MRMKVKRPKSWAFWVPFGLFLLCTPAYSDDGGISYGGSPQLLKDHKTISMRSEVVRVVIDKSYVTVDCQFDFYNNGPATTVRMGFPDEGAGGQDPYDVGTTDIKYLPPKTAFLKFRSFVDGKPVPTQLIRNKEQETWRVKEVSFHAFAVRRIRNVYKTQVGSQQASGGGWYDQAMYILHTGSSWKGSIGRAEIRIWFKRKFPSPPFRLAHFNSSQQAFDRISKINWWKIDKGTVYYQGPARAKVQGHTIRIVKNNLEPTEKDDVWLIFPDETSRMQPSR